MVVAEFVFFSICILIFVAGVVLCLFVDLEYKSKITIIKKLLFWHQPIIKTEKEFKEKMAKLQNKQGKTMSDGITVNLDGKPTITKISIESPKTGLFWINSVVQDEEGVLIVGGTGRIDSVRIHDIQHAKDLIKAIDMAIDYGWFKENKEE